MVMKHKFRLAILAALLSAPLAAASSFTGRVVGVMDGDTILVLTADYDQKKIRLAEIDAPEKAQPFGERSKFALSALCFKKMATVEVVDIDRYGRVVGKVGCDGINVNRVQVESGMAWVYRKYAKDTSLIESETIARSDKRGLWADKSPTPPWEWRKSNK